MPLSSTMLSVIAASLFAFCHPAWAAGPTPVDFAALHVGPDGQLLVSLDSRIYRSLDQGESWDQVLAPEDGDERPYFFDAGAFGVLVLGKSGIYRSTDQGATWVRTGDYHPVSAVDGAGTLFACQAGEVEYSSDQGRSWQLTAAQPQVACTYMLSFGKTVYVVPRVGPGIARSADGGKRWDTPQPFSARPPRKELPWGIFIDNQGTLYANTDGGEDFRGSVPRRIYRSTDEGRHWQRLTFGYAQPNAVDLRIETIGNAVVHMYCDRWENGEHRMGGRCTSDDGKTLKVESELSEHPGGSVMQFAADGRRYVISEGHIMAGDWKGRNWRVLGKKGLRIRVWKATPG